MIPRLSCSTCNSDIAWTDRFCPGCGAAVELPGGVLSGPGVGIVCNQCGDTNLPENQDCSSCGAPLRSARKKKQKFTPVRERRKTIAEPSSGKLIVGVAVFIIGGLVVLELFTGKKELPQPVAHQHEEAAVNAEALAYIEELEKQVAARPDDAPLVLQLANTLHHNRFYDKAIVYYTKYLKLRPNDADARVDLGICYNDSGNKDEAVGQIKEAIKKNPKHVLAHFNLGIIYLQASDVEEAGVWFRKTIELAPDSEAAQRARRLLAQHSVSSEPPDGRSQSTTN